MKMESMRGRKNVLMRRTALALLIILTLGGCGYKSLPVPPQEIIPESIDDLRYELDEKGVTLIWTYPAETVKGDNLDEITSFLLYRAVVPADQYCDTCPIPFGEPMQLPGGTVRAGKPKTATYETTLLRPGHLYFFKVRSRTGWWAESEDSNIVSFMWNIPPAAPDNLTVRPGDSRVLLAWQQVTTHMDGSPVVEPVVYQVYRSLAGGPFNPVGPLLTETECIDNEVVNGLRYGYKVQAVTVYEKGRVGGGIAGPVETSPVDLTPPPAPSEVQAIRTAAGVKVVWNPVQTGNISGYRIYRRLPGGTPVLIGEVAVPATIYDDRNLPETDHWSYSVTSIDDAEPANESAPSAEVGIER